MGARRLELRSVVPSRSSTFAATLALRGRKTLLIDLAPVNGGISFLDSRLDRSRVSRAIAVRRASSPESSSPAATLQSLLVARAGSASPNSRARLWESTTHFRLKDRSTSWGVITLTSS